MHILIWVVMVFKTPLTVSCPEFGEKGIIPARNTCLGENVSPEIRVENIPANAKSLVVLVDDPDACEGNFDHWLMWNIPVSQVIAANSAPGTQGRNSKNENRYYGPCLPDGKAHHYHFKVIALDQNLDLEPKSGRSELMKAIEGHVVAFGETVGTFKKPK